MNVLCPACHVTNRVEADRENPVCGRCKGPLDPRAPGYPVEASDANFEAMVVRAGLPVLVDFWAPWCGPCRALAPVLAALAAERSGKLRVVKVNTDEARFTAQRYGIKSLPTLVLFRGIEAGRVSGLLSQEALETWLSRWLPE